MKQRRLLTALVAAMLVAAVAIPILASSASAETSAANTVFIKDVKGALQFEAPKTIVAGEDLTVLNQTNPHRVGPHTFSMVTKGSLPKTPKARKLCFTPKHICMSIAKWHGVKGEGEPTKDLSTAGAAGWSTLGSLSKKGDSWFTGEKPGASITQPVSADTSAGPTRIYFMCAVHPWMQGSINVLPPPAG